MNVNLNSRYKTNLGLRFSRYLAVDLIERLDDLFRDVTNLAAPQYIESEKVWEVRNDYDDYLWYRGKICVATFDETTPGAEARILTNRLNIYGSTPRELEEMAARYVPFSLPTVIH